MSSWLPWVLLAWASLLLVYALLQTRALAALVAILREGGALGISTPSAWQGPLLGDSVPREARVAFEAIGVPLAGRRFMAVFVSSDCAACAHLLEVLAHRANRMEALIVFEGDARHLFSMAQGITPRLGIVEGAEGHSLHAALNVNATPAVVVFRDGRVDASALVTRGEADIAAVEQELAAPGLVTDPSEAVHPTLTTQLKEALSDD